MSIIPLFFFPFFLFSLFFSYLIIICLHYLKNPLLAQDANRSHPCSSPVARRALLARSSAAALPPPRTRCSRRPRTRRARRPRTGSAVTQPSYPTRLEIRHLAPARRRQSATPCPHDAMGANAPLVLRGAQSSSQEPGEATLF
jgi:hypothetical protein